MLPVGQNAHSQSHRPTDMIEWQSILTALKKTIVNLQKQCLLNVSLCSVSSLSAGGFIAEALSNYLFFLSYLFFDFCIRLFLI